MKLAVLYSGQARGDFIKNYQSVKHHFPDADFYFSTWHNAVQFMPPNVNYNTYPEPKMHYHPIVDVDDVKSMKLALTKKQCRTNSSLYERTLHHTKQILAHAYQLQDLDASYDMVIRVRYDCYLSPKVDLMSYLIKSYEENIAIGIGTRTTRHKNLHELKEIPRVHPETTEDIQDWSYYIMDPIIFHPRDLFDIDMVLEYHRDSKLLPAENGWYQILGEPHNDSHLCIYGGAQIEKYLETTTL
jgi:hypothetical protein|tara:strand:+ start:921 stop:1649 length:729 start_codon:yes stop_codon:yes gene_type:complete